MGERASERSLRELAEQLVLAAVGAVALTGERVEELADELAGHGAVRRDEAREAIDELVNRWRGDAVRVGERAGDVLSGLFGELGLVTRDDYEELELRLAQLEHRLRLLEPDVTAAEPPRPRPLA